ncbi:MAG: hypothetical protein NT154_30580 [Verrucomicrobia bacterium]|nr:hypothetical protein [Verrucomicrobiota bacterium]
MIDLQHLAVRYRLGLLHTDSLITVADALLEEGRDTSAVIELSMLESPIMHDAAPLFERLCTEAGVRIPTKDQAVSDLLRFHMEALASGARPAREGLQIIMEEIYWPYLASEPCKEYVGDKWGLQHLIGAYWGYDELPEFPQDASSGGKYGFEAIAQWQQFVRQQAQEWLQNQPPLAQRSIPTNGGPAATSGNSELSDGPPSVS